MGITQLALALAEVLDLQRDLLKQGLQTKNHISSPADLRSAHADFRGLTDSNDAEHQSGLPLGNYPVLIVGMENAILFWHATALHLLNS